MRLSKRFNRVRRAMERFQAETMLEFEIEFGDRYDEKLLNAFRSLLELKDFYRGMYETNLGIDDETLETSRLKNELEASFVAAYEEFQLARQNKKGVRHLRRVRRRVLNEIDHFTEEEYVGAAVCLARISALPSAYFMRERGVNGVNWFRGRSIRSNLERRAFERTRRLLNFQVAEPPQQYNDENNDVDAVNVLMIDEGNDDGENVLMIEEPPIRAVPIAILPPLHQD